MKTRGRASVAPWPGGWGLGVEGRSRSEAVTTAELDSARVRVDADGSPRAEGAASPRHADVNQRRCAGRLGRVECGRARANAGGDCLGA